MEIILENIFCSTLLMVQCCSICSLLMVNQCPERLIVRVIVLLLPKEGKVECSFCVSSNLCKIYNIVFILISICCRKWKDRHESSAPSGFSRFPAAEGDSDDDEEYEKERRKRSEYFCKDP